MNGLIDLKQQAGTGRHALFEQAAARRIMFKRVDDPDTFYVLGEGRIWSPPKATQDEAGALHAMATRRGIRNDLTHLLEGRKTEFPRKAVHSALRRVCAQLTDVSPDLGLVLKHMKLSTDPEDGRLWGLIRFTSGFTVDG